MMSHQPGRGGRRLNLLLRACATAIAVGAPLVGCGSPRATTTPRSDEQHQQPPSGPESSATAVPFGLDSLVLPDSPEDIVSVFAAMPSSVAARDRAAGPPGASEVRYQAAGVPDVGIEAASERSAFAGLTTIEAWLRQLSTDVHASAQSFDADSKVMFVVGERPSSDYDGTEYLAVWAAPGATHFFAVAADTGEARDDLVLAFVEAARQRGRGR